MPRSRTMKFFHTFYLLAIAVLGTLLFVERQNQSLSESNNELSAQITQLHEHLDNRLNEFSTHIDEQFNALEARMPTSSEAPASSQTAAPSSAQNPPIDRLPSSQHSSQPEPSDPLTSDDYARLGSAFVDDFDARQAEFDIQSVDPEWAYPSSNRIHELFNQHRYLNQLQLTSVECRSSICQVDIDMTAPQTIDPARMLRALNQVNDNSYDYEYRLLSKALEQQYRFLVLRVDNTQ